ncbi:three-Cys-motif partner protein TcmP [Candidatus Bathyarchaeota archaeon]|nr:three-Cys-motif partner protein TcmP [Candidatus Bathyarchaeota archaeon]
MSSPKYLKILPHTLHKYNVLQKYLRVCNTFDKHYSNFVYVDTHGGSGKVYLESSKTVVNGSPLIAGHWTPSFPCHIVEIDPETYGCLCQSTTGYGNIHTYHDDCNKLVPTILSNIPKGNKFVLFFVDPSALVYRGPSGTECDQLRSETIRAIAQFPRTELLLNFPLESILRCAGDCLRNPTSQRAIASGQRVTNFMGSMSWQKLKFDQRRTERNRREFLKLYLDEVLYDYPYKGAFLVRSAEKNLPLYYLVYTTHNNTAAKIMRDIMKKEGNFSLFYDISTGRPQHLDQVYPLERFIFEDQ